MFCYCMNLTPMPYYDEWLSLNTSLLLWWFWLPVNRTIWYELLCLEWPFQKLPPESVIWQVGKGMKQSLAHIQASRDIKVCFAI